MHPALGPVVKTRPQPFDPVRDGVRPVVVLLGELAQACEVGLAYELPLTDALRHRIGEPLLHRDAPHLLGQRAETRTAETLQQLPRPVAREQRRALERYLRVAEE